MKIHIISLQRTGSKSLYNAIHAALPNPYVFDDGAKLEEYFHCWSFYGYTFGGDAVRPFDKAASITFRSSVGHGRSTLKNFDHNPCSIQDKQVPSWYVTDMTEVLTFRDVLTRVNNCELMYKVGSDVLVKTQLASLFEELPIVDDKANLLAWLQLEAFNPLEYKTIFMSPDPDRLPEWVCSNYMCDTTGIFVKCTELTDAALRIKAEGITIPVDYVQALLRRLSKHYHLMTLYPTLAPELTTSQVSDKKTVERLSDYLGLDIHVPKVEKEMSVVNYEETVVNYEDVTKLCNIAFPNRNCKHRVISAVR